jgi:ribonucleotide reductase alpha subunit
LNKPNKKEEGAMASEKFGITEGNGKTLLSELDIVDYNSANLESNTQTKIPNHESQAEKVTEVIEYKEGVMDIPKETIDSFGGDELRARVFYEKYALRSETGKIVEKKPDEMWRRVAREIASPEKTQKFKKEWEEKFYWLLSDFRFIPGGRILFGAGQNRRATLLNCYYMPIK